MSDSARGEASYRIAQMRCADRRAPGLVLPFFGQSQQSPYLGMHEPDAHGQLPPVPMPLQAARPEYLHPVTVVLFEPPDTVVEYAPSLHKLFAYQGREAVFQHPGDECRKDGNRVSLEGTDA